MHLSFQGREESAPTLLPVPELGWLLRAVGEFARLAPPVGLGDVHRPHARPPLVELFGKVAVALHVRSETRSVAHLEQVLLP